MVVYSSETTDLSRANTRSRLTMKHLCTFLITFSLTLTSLHAQEITANKASRFGFGVFAGVNYTYPIIRMPFPDHFNSQTNLLAGVDVRYRLTPWSELHLQPSYTKSRDVQSRYNSATPIFSLSSFKLPLAYRQYVVPSHKRLFLEGGLSYNHIASSHYIERLDVVCITSPCPVFYSGDIRPSTKSAVSGLAAIGTTIDVQKVSIPITLRYERYLSSYLFPRPFDAPPIPVKFESFAITTGVNF
jgi:hypothetical protein